MVLNSHISAYARCLARKVCGLVRSTSRGEDTLGARDRTLTTKVVCRACAGRAPGKHTPLRALLRAMIPHVHTLTLWGLAVVGPWRRMQMEPRRVGTSVGISFRIPRCRNELFALLPADSSQPSIFTPLCFSASVIVPRAHWEAYGRGSLPLHNLVSDLANPHFVSDPLPRPLWDHRSTRQL